MENKMQTDESRREHEAIRAQMQFLGRKFADLTTTLTGPSATMEKVREVMSGYRLALYDLRDGLEHHCEVDEQAFVKIPDEMSVRGLKREHSSYRKQIDDAILLAESGDERSMTVEQLAELSRRIDELMSGTAASIIDHLNRENLLLNTTH
jgi:hypothetical protein